MYATIHIPRVTDALLAGSALAAVCSVHERPPLLNPDHEPALRVGVRAIFDAVALQLAPYLKAVDRENADDPVLHFDASIAADGETVARAVESIVELRMLHQLHASAYPAVAAACGAQAADMLDALFRYILARAPGPGRIRPSA